MNGLGAPANCPCLELENKLERHSDVEQTKLFKPCKESEQVGFVYKALVFSISLYESQKISRERERKREK